MRSLIRRRPLAFEQMEQRLVLSAAPATTTWFFDDFDVSDVYLLAADKIGGGDIAVGAVLNWTDRSTSLSANDAGFVDIWDGEIIFNEPIFSKPDVDGPLESSEAGSLVTPIPQPQIGDGEITQGLIAVAEIFRPTKLLPASQVDQQLVQGEAVETTVAQASDDSWKSISLSRGRDMYFEVAAMSADRDTNGRNGADLSSKITPLIYQQALRRREVERAASTTSQERTNAPQQLPPLSPVPHQEPRPADSKHSEAPTDDAAVEKTERTAQDGERPMVDAFSQVAEPRDHVFADWNDGDELSDEAIALRTETQQGHSATWPVLAALAATGWMARTRHLKGVLPSHRQPLRRK